jgi:hypothetical protein
MTKTSELINRFSAASQRYEIALKNSRARRKSVPVQEETTV